MPKQGTIVTLTHEYLGPSASLSLSSLGEAPWCTAKNQRLVLRLDILCVNNLHQESGYIWRFSSQEMYDFQDEVIP